MKTVYSKLYRTRANRGVTTIRGQVQGEKKFAKKKTPRKFVFFVLPTTMFLWGDTNTLCSCGVILTSLFFWRNTNTNSKTIVARDGVARARINLKQ